MKPGFRACSAKTVAPNEIQLNGVGGLRELSFTHIGDHTTERRKPNDQNENAKCLDSSFRGRCHASVGSGSRQAGARKPVRIGFTVQPARSI